jgi:hypothetical protein
MVEVELMVDEPEQHDTRLSQVGESAELVSTTLLELYLNDVVGRCPGPHQHGGAVIGTVPLRHELQ